jgi:hypothetical protein
MTILRPHQRSRIQTEPGFPLPKILFSELS